MLNFDAGFVNIKYGVCGVWFVDDFSVVKGQVTTQCKYTSFYIQFNC